MPWSDLQCVGASEGEVVTSTEEVKRHKNLGIEARPK